MKILSLVLAGLIFVGSGARGAVDASNYAGPKRINKAIELLASGQPVYYDYGRGGYAEGKAAAKTWADILMYDMEGNAMDFSQLRAFMQGLVDGGPTASGHRTPAVIVTLPVYGLNETTVQSNHWMIQQALACGVHGLHLCHARNPEAVRAFVAAARFEIHREGVGAGLDEGIRMFGAHDFAAKIWGVSPREYYALADAWPLNPKGELMLGVKIEDHVGQPRAAEITAVPGLCFAEWGPRDTSYSSGHIDVAFDYGRKAGVVQPPELVAAAQRVIAAAKEHHLHILDNARTDDLLQQLEAGIDIIAGGSKDVADLGRKHTHREMP